MRCWMAVFARVMERIADHISSLQPVTGVKSMSDHLGHTYRTLSATLSDPDLLDELHWSSEHSMYADYGLHTDTATLVRPSRQPNTPVRDPPVRGHCFF